MLNDGFVYTIYVQLCIMYIVYLIYFNMNLDRCIVFSNILYTFAHNIKVTNYEYCSSSDKKKEH